MLPAQALFKDGDLAAALEKYSEAIALAVRLPSTLLVAVQSDTFHSLHQPTSALLYGNRSLTHLKSSLPALALTDAQKATELGPNWGKAWVRLGEALEASERIPESVDAYLKAVEMAEGLVMTGMFALSRVSLPRVWRLTVRCGFPEAKQKLEAARKKLGWH